MMPSPGHIGAALAGLWLSALPALACPAPGDLRLGIVMTALDGTTDTYIKVTEDFVQGLYSDGGGTGAQYLLMKGVYVVEVADIANDQPVPGSSISYSYPGAPDAARVPAPGEQWDTPVTILEGGVERQARESFAFGDATLVTIGACEYAMIPVTATYHDEGGYSERLHYLPDLGFAYLAATQEPGQAADPVVYVRIELAAP